MKNKAILIILLALGSLAWPASGDARAGDGTSLWNGYKRLDFTVDGRACLLVVPDKAAAGKPWIWRTEFFGHEPQADLELLDNGFHVAYMDVQNMYGAPVALDHMDAFYDHLTKNFGLSAKTTLEGLSRGGLFALNWAARHPERVASLYLDAPVCDFKVWPRGMGKNPVANREWQQLLQVYGLTDEQAMAYTHNPVDNLAPLAAAHIPILSVIGLADTTVPPATNTLLVEERYKQLGGSITVIAKPFCNHHPHSLRDPTPIVNFVLGSVGMKPAEGEALPRGQDYFNLADGLNECRDKFLREKKGRVVFPTTPEGASPDWKDMICEDMQFRFPETHFEFVNGGAAFKAPGKNPAAGAQAADLMFVEVIEGDPTHAAVDVVAKARQANPEAQIVLLNAVDPRRIPAIDDGKHFTIPADAWGTPEHDGVPSVHLAGVLGNCLTESHLVPDARPAAFCQRLYAHAIERLLDAEWKPSASPDGAVKGAPR